MTELDLKDVRFLSNSVADSFGRVFTYEGQIYRMVSPEQESLCREILEARFFRKLTELEYIPRTVVEEHLTIRSGGRSCLILWHETCPDTRQHEWSFEMFKAAVIHLLKVRDICREDGYDLKDYHLGNITFRGTRPVFIDIGSFVKRSADSVMNDEFFTACLLPLLLWRDGEYFLNRCIVSDNTHYSFLIPFQQASHSTIVGSYKSQLSKPRGHLLDIFKNRLKKVYNTCIDVFHLGLRKRTCRDLPVGLPTVADISRIQRKHLPAAAASHHRTPPLPSDVGWLDSAVGLILRHCADATTLTDLAGREGQLCLRLSSCMKLHRVFMIENDEDATDKAFVRFAQNNVTTVTPVFTNAMFPLHGEQDVRRLRSDLVVALGVSHRLLLSQHFHVSFLFERLSMYTTRYVCIDFMPSGLCDGPAAAPPPSWYNETWFTSHFLMHFRLVRREQLAPNSILFIGEKKINTKL